jgi:eukaryotic-like serine/threonine-protein kinase
MGPDAVETRSILKELKEGTVIAGKYRVDAVLGRGAMGVVVAATHQELREKVALKFLYVRADNGSDFRARFRREAQVSAKLKNEHITRVIDIGTWREHALFMVMEHLTGTDLRKVTRDFGALPVDRAIDYVVQVCEGMAEAHAHGIIHRDLKPSNLFVTKRADGTDLIKILDFGISKWSAQEGELDDLTQTGVVLGSPKYMSPEQLFGSGAVDARADVWSIGAILYELLVGRPPFDFPTLTRICAELSSTRPPPSMREQRPDLPEGLDEVVLHALERDRDNRIDNVADLAGAILDAVGSPFAAAVKLKLQATLDAATGREFLAATTGSLALSSGAFGSMSSAPGRATGSQRAAVEGARPSGSRATLVVLLLLAALAAGAVFYLRKMATAPIAVAPSSATPATSSAPAPSVPASSSATTIAMTATASAASASSTASTSSAAPPKSAPPPAWIQRSRGVTPPSATKAPPPPVDTPAPTPPPVQTTPPPAPTPKVDPLHDRQ